MENVNGTSFVEFFHRRGGNPLSPGEALVYLKAMVASLEQIHARGLVHGDIKASNVMLDSQGRVFLEGVGFAQRIGSRSVVRQPIQPVPHLAPELVSYQEVTEAADVFSLGVLLYKMLTGEHPSTGTSTLRSPRQLNSSISQSLSQVVLRAMAQNLADRFQTPREFFASACGALNLSPEQIPDRLTPATLPLAPATVPQAPATVVIQSSPSVHATMVVPSAPQVLPIETGYSEQTSGAARGRPVWQWLGIGLLGFIILLCVGFLVGSRLPALISRLGSTKTPTWTATLLPSNTPLPSSTPIDTATPLPVIPTDTFAPPPPPTLPPPPTDTSSPPATFTSLPTGGDLQVRNRFPYPLYVFRDRRSLNSAPIPPGMYLIFFNQPSGMHIYRFCRDLNMNDCLEKEITITGNLEITVP